MALISTITDDEPSLSVDVDQFCRSLCSVCNVARWLQRPHPPDLDGKLNSQTRTVMYTENQEESVELSDVAALSPECPVCSMIDSLLPAKGTPGGMQISLGILAETIRPPFHWSINHPREEYSVLNITIESELTNEPPLIDVRLVKSHQSMVQNVVVREIIPNEIDWELVAKWLDCCDTDHTGDCGPSTMVPVPGFKLIDCFTKEIVEKSPGDCKYVALSYVWGEQKSSGCESSIFSRTVEDSIKAVVALGYRYLWVDRHVRLGLEAHLITRTNTSSV